MHSPIATCNAERSDSSSDTVKARIMHVHDLHAADVALIFAQKARYQ